MGMGEGMGEGEGGMVVGKGVVGSGVGQCGLSGQCGMGVGMVQEVGVGVVGVQGGCGGQTRERVIQLRKVEGKAWVLEGDLVG